MNELVAVAAITLLATISPGPDFAMVTRNSLLHGRTCGLLAAGGIALGVQLHVLYSMAGVAVLMAQWPALYAVLRTAGAIYLIHVGWRTLRCRAPETAQLAARSMPSSAAAFRTGFLTNALIPKTTLFVVSTYAQVVGPHTPWGLQFQYGLFMSAAHFMWFSLVATFFSQPAFRDRVMRHQRTVDRVIGVILLGLGAWLALPGASQ